SEGAVGDGGVGVALLEQRAAPGSGAEQTTLGGVAGKGAAADGQGTGIRVHVQPAAVSVTSVNAALGGVVAEGAVGDGQCARPVALEQPAAEGTALNITQGHVLADKALGHRQGAEVGDAAAPGRFPAGGV